MSDSHEPECDATDCGCVDEEECGDACRHTCICDRLIAARNRGYGEAMDDGWGEPGHIKAEVEAERERIRVAVKAKCSWQDPRACKHHWPVLAIIDGKASA